MTNEETKKLLDEYKKDPVTFRLKYGSRAESDLLETAHKKGMTKEVQKKTAKYGGKMNKKKYAYKGRVIPDKGMTKDDLYNKWISRAQDSHQADLYKRAYRLAEIENRESGGKAISDMDFEHALNRVNSMLAENTGYTRYKSLVDKYMTRGRGTGSPHTEMQQGGMADMSAAPMMQPRKKKKKQSGFRTKYSKGGGVRSAKYKI